MSYITEENQNIKYREIRQYFPKNYTNEEIRNDLKDRFGDIEYIESFFGEIGFRVYGETEIQTCIREFKEKLSICIIQ